MTNPIVIKFGGSLLEDKSARLVFLRSLAEEWKLSLDSKLKDARPKILLVHGGGKDITKELERQKIPARFEKGRRYTDEATMRVVEEVLAKINSEIVGQLKAEGAKAEGTSGKAKNFVKAKPIQELGLVGVPSQVDPKVLDAILSSPELPVFYTVAVGKDGEALNINADDFAQELAIACRASQLIFMTDTGGIRDKSGELIELITPSDVEKYIADQVVTGGMAVKARACVAALERGVSKVVIAHEVNLGTTLPVHAFGTSFLRVRSGAKSE